LEKLEKEDVAKVKERVKALASQQDPSESLILITLDALARLSRKLGDKDMEMHEELYRQCGRLQGKVNIANLCLTVLGGQGADIVSKAANKCIKEGNLGPKSEGMKAKDEGEQNQGSRGCSSPLARLYPMYSPPLGFFNTPGYQQYPFQPLSNFGAYGKQRPYKGSGGMGRRSASRLACHICDSTHLVKEGSEEEVAGLLSHIMILIVYVANVCVLACYCIFALNELCKFIICCIFYVLDREFWILQPKDSDALVDYVHVGC
jgi:hypothetical protein